MYGPYTETLHTNHLRRVDLSSHFIDWSLCFFAFYYREKKNYQWTSMQWKLNWGFHLGWIQEWIKKTNSKKTRQRWEFLISGIRTCIIRKKWRLQVWKISRWKIHELNRFHTDFKHWNLVIHNWYWRTALNFHWIAISCQSLLMTSVF